MERELEVSMPDEQLVGIQTVRQLLESGREATEGLGGRGGRAVPRTKGPERAVPRGRGRDTVLRRRSSRCPTKHLKKKLREIIAEVCEVDEIPDDDPVRGSGHRLDDGHRDRRGGRAHLQALDPGRGAQGSDELHRGVRDGSQQARRGRLVRPRSGRHEWERRGADEPAERRVAPRRRIGSAASRSRDCVPVPRSPRQ